MLHTPSLIQTVTVGTGIAPVPARPKIGQLADYTAGGDFRPAPKTMIHLFCVVII